MTRRIQTHFAACRGLALAGLCAAMLGGAAFGQTTSYTGPNAGNGDTWNNGANWTGGVPSGTINVVIDTGKFAGANNAATPAYTGNLTLNANSTLKVWQNSLNAYGTGPITMGAGSKIVMRHGAYTFGPITLLGNATMATGESTTGHHTTKTFASAVSGAFDFTIEGVNNNTINFNVANGFSSFTTDKNFGTNFRVHGLAAGSLGTGNVTINDTSTLFVDAADAISDTATLTLNGGRDTKLSASFSKLHLNANETVNKLVIDGVAASAGTYTNTSSFLSGGGTLTVLNSDSTYAGPSIAATDFVDEFFAAGPNTGYDQIWQDFTSVEYTLTFDGDVDLATLTAADFENAGGATGFGIGAITKTLTPPLPNGTSEVTVEVTLTSPSTGPLQLQIKAGTDVKDVLGNSLNTASAIADNTTITINAGNIPNATITGTTGGNDSWNQPANWDTTPAASFVPFGPGSAIVDAGVLAQVNTAPPAYTGTLTLEAGATLRINNPSAVGVVGTPSSIILKSGSKIDLRDGSPTFSAIEPQGDATIGGAGNPAHHETFTFNGPLSGAGHLTIAGVNNETFRFNTSSPTWTGGVETADPANQRHQVDVYSNGAFGTGDVAINNNASLRINTGLSDTIDDGAIFTVNGARSTTYTSKLVLNSSETVGAFVLDGALMAAGNYDTSSGLLDVNSLNLITGSGTLTVAGAPLYWDTNGATSGTDPGAMVAGTWGVDSFWSLDANGEDVTLAWADGYDAVFSAGTNGTGTQMVAVAGPQSAKSLTVEEGTVNFTDGGGGSINVTGDSAVKSGATAAINVTTNGTNFNVESGGVLKGTGTINGDVNLLSGGTHAVGNSIGTQTVTNETWNGGSVLELEFDDFMGTAGTNWDLLNVANELTVSATTGDEVVFKILSLDPMNDNFDANLDYSDLLIANANTLTGFDPSLFIIDTSMFSHDLMGGMFAVSTDGNNVFLNFLSAAVVPEPTSVAIWSLIGIGLAGLGVWRNRRKK